ncbi:hypothetical protein N825_13170 [Skermanella stibiiresistens SB22]|uniref:Uncharacterized protein n=1 Tax=Skermanella stibiiresistens SB22 TaxID=1385369 RepID=W9H418_9PROT|nr:hypothetical protein [Skermanella stibiiresistens]EWY38508.1 hypothetical protein N825_13170 [Skermanella stibiiresistens SB22]
MPIRFWRRRRAEPPLTVLVDALTAAPASHRVALMILTLGPKLGERLDLDKCLRLTAVGGLTPEAAGKLGDPVPDLLREREAAVNREARFVETLERLATRVDLNTVPAWRWNNEDRHRLFDPDFLARRCADDPVLAELNDLLWRRGVERLRQAGENPATLALEAMGLAEQAGLQSMRCR